jgi:acetyl esterase/lipase
LRRCFHLVTPDDLAVSIRPTERMRWPRRSGSETAPDDVGVAAVDTRGVPNAGRVVVAGDSSGGALAMALVVVLRDAGQDLPAGLALFSPMVDMTASGESVGGREDRDPIFTADAIRVVGPGSGVGPDS